MEPKIVYRDLPTDIAARTDHQEGIIELNENVWPNLTDDQQLFVLCHEYAHLSTGTRDEAEANAMAAAMLGDDCRYSNVAVTTVMAIVSAAPAIAKLGVDGYNLIKQIRNKYKTGWKSFDAETKKALAIDALAAAFLNADRSGKYSAADYFWEIMRQYINTTDLDSLDKFLKKNSWVLKLAARYEAAYGFGFYAVTPANWLAFPAVKLAAALLVVAIIIMTLKK